MTDNQKQDFEGHRTKTPEIRAFMISCVVKLVEIWECEWLLVVQDDPEAAEVRKRHRFKRNILNCGVQGIMIRYWDILKAS